MRFVDEEQAFAPFAGETLELADHVLQRRRAAGAPHAECLGHAIEQLVAIEAHARQLGGHLALAVDLLQKPAPDGGLADSEIADQRDEFVAATQPVLQGPDGRAMRRRVDIEVRIGRDAERQIRQPEVGFVHRCLRRPRPHGDSNSAFMEL